jgi:hypothetical protein
MSFPQKNGLCLSGSGMPDARKHPRQHEKDTLKVRN